MNLLFLGKEEGRGTALLFGAIVRSSIASLGLRRAGRVRHKSGKNRLSRCGLKTLDVRSSGDLGPVRTLFADGRELRIDGNAFLHHLAMMLTGFPAACWNIRSVWNREQWQDEHPLENNR